MSIYEEQGYKDRNEYIEGLAENNGCSVEFAKSLADILGEEEDFDGLVTSIQDHMYRKK